jgi:hypothetical protein
MGAKHVAADERDDAPSFLPARGLMSRPRAPWAKGGLILLIVLNTFMLLVRILAILGQGESLFPVAEFVVDWVFPAAAVAVPFAFLRWLTAIMRDVHGLRGELLGYTPLQAAIRFCVPIVNWFVSRTLMVRLRDATAPEAFPAPIVDNPLAGYREAARITEVPRALSDARVRLWSAAWIGMHVSRIAGPVAVFSLLGAEDRQAKLESVRAFSDALAICAAVLMVQVISALDARVTEQHRRALASSIGAGPMAPERSHGDFATPLAAVAVGGAVLMLHNNADHLSSMSTGVLVLATFGILVVSLTVDDLVTAAATARLRTRAPDQAS